MTLTSTATAGRVGSTSPGAALRLRSPPGRVIHCIRNPIVTPVMGRRKNITQLLMRTDHPLVVVFSTPAHGLGTDDRIMILPDRQAGCCGAATTGWAAAPRTPAAAPSSGSATAKPSRRRRTCSPPRRRGCDRDKSDYHFRKTATEYDRKPGIKWLSCTAK